MEGRGGGESQAVADPKKGILEFIFGCHPADSMPLSDMT
jgi:hypothetical protein